MHMKFGGHASMMPGRVRTLTRCRPPSTTTVWPVINALFVAGKKADRASDIARSPDAFDGLLLGDFGEDSPADILLSPGRTRSGVFYGVDRDAERCKVVGQSAGQADHSGLAGHVVDQSGYGEPSELAAMLTMRPQLRSRIPPTSALAIKNCESRLTSWVRFHCSNLAQAAGVGVRQLQKLFRDEFDMSPRITYATCGWTGRGRI